jgi:mycothiol system anti-sigma-R factor
MTEGGDCRIAIEKIFSYLDGEMGEMDCRELERHLKECGKCATCREVLEKTISLGRDRVEAPGELREKMLETIRKKLEE